MDSITLEDVANLLPNASTAHIPTPHERYANALTSPASAPSEEFFFPPTFTVVEGSITDHPPLIFISAQAAVGKSMISRALSDRTKNPRWDLGSLNIGNGTWKGTLVNAYDFEAAAEFSRDLSAGRVAVIMDALDESTLRSGGVESLEVFIRELASNLSESAASRSACVILGRSETIELACIAASEESCRYLHLSVDYFNYEQACEFIDEALDRSDQSLSHRRHRVPFLEVRDLIFGEVSRIIASSEQNAWDRRETRAFLGYAPVLLAIRDLLQPNESEPANYQKLVERFRARTAHGTLWALLNSIVKWILEREAQKYRAQIEPMLTRAEDINFLFDPIWQCLLLVDPAGLAADLSATPSVLPTRLQDFQRAIRQFATDHPFVAGAGHRSGRGVHQRFGNVVFRDYALAVGLLHGSNVVSRHIRDACSHADYQASPLLGRFALELLSQDDELSMRADDVGIVVESLSAGVENLVVSSNDRSADAPIIRLGQILDPATGEPLVELLVDEGELTVFGSASVRAAGEELVFTRSLSHVEIDLPAMNITIGAGDSVTIGPRCFVRCRRLTVFAAASLVRTQIESEFPDVEIDVDEFVDPLNHAAPRVTHQPGLKVRSRSPVPFLWSPYYEEPFPTQDSLEELFVARQELWSVFKWFKRGVKPGLRYPVKPLESALAKNKLSSRMFTYLRNEGVLVQDGREWVLNVQDLNFGVSAVRSSSFDDGLYEFLERYVSRMR